MKIGFCKGISCSRLYQQLGKPYKYQCAGGSAIDDFTPIEIISEKRCDNRRSRCFNQADNKKATRASHMVREIIID